MDKSQREYVLRRQLDAIRKELGDEDGADDTERYRERIAETPLSDEARKEAERELKRLDSTGPGHPEASTIRTYLDWLLSLPWGKESEDQDDVAAAGAVLEADHAGLEEVKDRILEYLAVRSFRRKREIEDEGGGAILCLVGPPGVGKTSLGESIARALGREFVRMSLGGIRDEAEIRGHRRTYIGALPGRLVRALRDAGTMNPVILLDEVDKLGADWRGDPSSALLEVLDPAQNSTFRDHYLDLKVDLSKVLFIATANVAEQIPEALLDRLEVIRIDGYTEDEKVAIAQRYLVPRAERRNGLEAGEVVIEDEALRRIVTEYTREAGVRNVERLIQKVLRKSAKKLAEGAETPITVVAGDLRELLGRPRPDVDMARRESVAGVATGLAVTGSGGDVLVVEATEMAGKGLTLTGQLGDVMSESATIALSYVRSHGDLLGIDVGGARRARGARPRAGRRDPQGRTVRGRHDDGRARLAHVRARGARRRRHDRRGHAAGPRAAGRRHQAEGARGAPGRAHRRDPALAQRRRPGRAPPERPRGRALPPRRPRRRGPGGRARAGARRDRLAIDGAAHSGSDPECAALVSPKENAGGQRTPFPMKTIFSFVGFVVVMILLASTGVVKGDACLSNVGCVGANGSGITFHSPEHGHVHDPLIRVASPFGRAARVSADGGRGLAHRARAGDQEPALAGRLLADRAGGRRRLPALRALGARRLGALSSCWSPAG